MWVERLGEELEGRWSQMAMDAQGSESDNAAREWRRSMEESRNGRYPKGDGNKRIEVA
jgi:hypothetical protein